MQAKIEEKNIISFFQNKRQQRYKNKKHTQRRAQKVLPLLRVPATSDTSTYFPIFTLFHLNFHSLS